MNSLDKESIDLNNLFGFYDEEDCDRYCEENFIYENEYENFLEDNNIEEVKEYIKNKNDVLFIKELKLTNITILSQ